MLNDVNDRCALTDVREPWISLVTDVNNVNVFSIQQYVHLLTSTPTFIPTSHEY